MNKCKQIEKEISAYIDNELNEIQRKEVKEHIKKCYKCKKKLEELQELWELLDLYTLEDTDEKYKSRNINIFYSKTLPSFIIKENRREIYKKKIYKTIIIGIIIGSLIYIGIIRTKIKKIKEENIWKYLEIYETLSENQIEKIIKYIEKKRLYNIGIKLKRLYGFKGKLLKKGSLKLKNRIFLINLYKEWLKIPSKIKNKGEKIYKKYINLKSSYIKYKLLSCGIFIKNYLLEYNKKPSLKIIKKWIDYIKIYRNLMKKNREILFRVYINKEYENFKIYLILPFKYKEIWKNISFFQKRKILNRMEKYIYIQKIRFLTQVLNYVKRRNKK